MIALEPDVLFAVQTSSSAGAALTKQLHELDLRVLHLYAFLPSKPEFYELCGEAADYIVWTAMPSFVPKLAKDFVDKFKARYGREPTMDSAGMYYSMKIVADAIERAGSLDPHKIAEALSNTNFDTAFGRIVFSPKTHEALLGIDYVRPITFQLINGTSYVVWPPDIQDRPFEFPPYIKD